MSTMGAVVLSQPDRVAIDVVAVAAFRPIVCIGVPVLTDVSSLSEWYGTLRQLPRSTPRSDQTDARKETVRRFGRSDCARQSLGEEDEMSLTP
jgi:hypothetical protein